MGRDARFAGRESAAPDSGEGRRRPLAGAALVDRGGEQSTRTAPAQSPQPTAVRQERARVRSRWTAAVKAAWARSDPGPCQVKVSWR